MKIGLSYDLKEAVSSQDSLEDAFEEYDSPETVAAISAALEGQGHSVVRLGGGREFLARILNDDVDLVFNISEGLGNYRSREAQIPSVLEMLGIPYTGSDPQCLAICLDKPLANKMVALAGVTTPKCQVITDTRQLEELDWKDFPFPAFLKPAHEGSSKGIRFGSKVINSKELTETVTTLLGHYRQPIMVEEFIAGDEVTVGIITSIEPKVLGIMHIVPRKKDANFIYSLEVKRDWERLVDYECPAQLDAGLLQEITNASLKAFKVLECRDFARVDFRVDTGGKPYFLEINPLAGLNPKSSDLVIMARKMGWTYEDLISAVLNAAIERDRSAA